LLHEFLIANRDTILDLTRARVAKRAAPRPTHEELTVGIPRFFDDLAAILAGESDRGETINREASLHGERRQYSGFTVAQVVHDYGDLCQVVTQLAIDLNVRITTQDFKTLNGCLDNAIAEAVTEYARQRARLTSEEEVQRLGFLAHELRNHLQTATLSFQALKMGTVAIGGSTGALLGRSLTGLQTLIDGTLAQVRMEAGVHHHERVEMVPFLEEVEAAGSIVASDRGMSLSMDRGDAGVCVEADRQLLGSAVSNLLQNAFKYSRPNGHVHVGTTATADRVMITIEDQCGGTLTAAQIEGLGRGFGPRGQDKSGLGLGLSICQRAIEAMRGSVRARNKAGIGCVFTLDLPRLVGGAVQ